MKKLAQLWRAIEETPGLLAISAVWRQKCGGDFPYVERFLNPTFEKAATYPCPYPTGYNCPRLIVELGDDEVDAICRDPHGLCPDLRLKSEDAVICKLDLPSFMKPVLKAAGVSEQELDLRTSGVWSVGLSRRRSSRNQPCFLLIFGELDGFQAAARDLLLEVPGPFLVVAPTDRHRTVSVQERLQARGIGYVALEEHVLIDDQGGFVAIDPLDSIDRLQPTPVADRDRVVREFRKKHKCKVYQIQEAAGVEDPEYYGWLHGTDPDHYASCIRIEQVLHYGLPPPGSSMSS